MVWCSVLSFKRTLWDHCRVQRRTKKQMDTKRNKERRGWWGELCPFHSSETEALIKRSHLTEKAKKAGCNKTNTSHGDKKKIISSWHAICILLPKAWRSRKNTHFDMYISEGSFFLGWKQILSHYSYTAALEKLASGKVRRYMQQCMMVKPQVCMWKHVREKSIDIFDWQS